jgi:hypothetical protein
VPTNRSDRHVLARRDKAASGAEPIGQVTRWQKGTAVSASDALRPKRWNLLGDELCAQIRLHRCERLDDCRVELHPRIAEQLAEGLLAGHGHGVRPV